MIVPSGCVRNLGVLMSDDCTFDKHIDMVIDGAKKS